MKVVVADTSPINYLVLIDCIDVLQRLYARIIIPQEVFNELNAAGTPPRVVDWIQSRPDWIEVRLAPIGDSVRTDDHELELDPGEAAAIRLAMVEQNTLLLIDEAAGRAVATRLGVANTGTLGVLLAAAKEDLIDLRVALSRLQDTNFRISRNLVDRLLADSQ
jgi:predicted nucleic acid-binding protein